MTGMHIVGKPGAGRLVKTSEELTFLLCTPVVLSEPQHLEVLDMKEHKESGRGAHGDAPDECPSHMTEQYVTLHLILKHHLRHNSVRFVFYVG